jgi:hypothetical protein
VEDLQALPQAEGRILLRWVQIAENGGEIRPEIVLEHVFGLSDEQRQRVTIVKI